MRLRVEKNRWTAGGSWYLSPHVKISELIYKLSAIHEEEGDCDVFAALATHTSQFLVAEAVFADRNDPRWEPTAPQAWLPPRVVLSLRLV